ncbi:MAG: hypothetical protein EP329_04880 [Deltaproteobacteria bacterium]|nr:MAG: hypothetical protein EP329_04880 [Deltaproteobacteria bacterium]
MLPAPPSPLRPLAATALTALLALTACPTLPSASQWTDADAGEGDAEDTFVPLSLERLVESVGEPDGGERVAIFGAGITPGATVTFGTTLADNVLVLDETQINVDVPAGDPGLVNVTVVLPDGQKATLVDGYLYRGDLEASAIEPTLGPVAGGIAITVRGEGFTDATRVVIGDRLLEDAERIDASTLVGTLPARLAADAGVVDVVVTDGFEQRVLPGAFRYIAPPRVDWLSPASGTTHGGTEVTLYGRGLDADTVVSFAGAVAEILVPGHGEAVTVRTPPGDAGPADVVVMNPLDTTTLAGAWTYVDPDAAAATPSLINAWPGRGTSQGGTQVALTVTGLEGTDEVSVSFGEEPATVVQVRPSEDLVVVATPNGAPGPATITVTAPNGVTARDDLFVYDRAFSVSALDPVFGPVAGGTTVKVSGIDLSADSVVLFGGKLAGITRVGAGYVEVSTPAAAPGRVDVTIRDGSRSVTLPAAFEYRSPARGEILAITPGEGARSGGRIVRVHGQGFRGGFGNLRFGDAEAEDQRVVDDALMIVRAPRGNVGNVNVSDFVLGRLAMAYRYFDPTQRYGGTVGGPIPEALNVTVLNIVSGKPVDEAFVILWDDVGTPYQGLTDDRGQLTFSDVGFGPLQMVTASKDNYTTASVVEFDARDVTLQLIPLISSPSGGGGGGGAQQLPDSTLTGAVSGLDKYVLPPPGSCDNRLILGDPVGVLCQPCVSEADCGGEGALCTDLGDQGHRCTTACQTDQDCPDGYSCKGVEGGIQCLPSPGERTARCGVTQPDVFSDPSGPSYLAGTNSEGVYSLTSRPGEYAVVCLGGYEDELGAFVPTMMGVRRHVFALPGDVVGQQDVHLDIPLNRTLRIRLDGAPTGRAETALHTVDVFVDLGADGVYHMPESGEGIDRNLFTLDHFPARFAESLYDASYTVYATAVPDVPPSLQTGEGSFVHYDEITEADDDTVFTLDADGARSAQSGVSVDIHAVHGAGDGRLWAVADDGEVLIHNGALWGLGQAPTDATLRGVWSWGGDDVWAVGDDGAVMRYDGLRWRAVTMPAGFEQVDWRGIHGVDGVVWMWSNAGLWTHDGIATAQITTDFSAAAVHAVWADETGAAWVVGDGGLVRRWQDGAFADFDVEGPDLNAVWGTASDDVWAVGDDGRVMHWDGSVWFDLLPVTSRSLAAVHADAADSAWAVGDAGAVLRWDGVAWTVTAEVEHSDLRGVWTTVEGESLAVGLHTLVIGPFMQVARPKNPTAEGVLRSLRLQWNLDPGADASLTWLQLQHSSGFPFWTIVANGPRDDVPLPDLQAAWGLQALWPGEGFFQVVRAYMPYFSIDAYDNTILTPYAWRSWSVTGWPLVIEQ